MIGNAFSIRWGPRVAFAGAWISKWVDEWMNGTSGSSSGITIVHQYSFEGRHPPCPRADWEGGGLIQAPSK